MIAIWETFVKNLILLKSRTASVRNYLIDKMGIDSERLLFQGRGEYEPLIENTTPLFKVQKEESRI